MTEFNESDVDRLADLAKLRLGEAERVRMTPHVARLLTYFESLAEVDTDGVEPSTYPLPLPPSARDDVPLPPLTRDEVLANAPQSRGGCFRVPRTVTG